MPLSAEDEVVIAGLVGVNTQVAAKCYGTWAAHVHGVGKVRR